MNKVVHTYLQSLLWTVAAVLPSWAHAEQGERILVAVSVS